MRMPMLTGLLAACSLTFLTSSASAQRFLAEPVVIDEPATLNAGRDEEIVIRETIIRRRPAGIAPPVALAPRPLPSVPVPTAGYIRPGSIIPADVELAPYDDGFSRPSRRYSYFVSPSNRIVLVDPIERRVLRVLER
jgi:hypothetical protein